MTSLMTKAFQLGHISDIIKWVIICQKIYLQCSPDLTNSV